MTQRWGRGQPDPAQESIIGHAHNLSAHPAMAALAGFLALTPAAPGAGLFLGAGLEQRQEASITGLDHRAGIKDCFFPCRLARDHGLAGPWFFSAPGAAGGLELIARAQKSLAKGMSQAICLAADDSAWPDGGYGESGIAAVLGLQAGHVKGAAFLGKVESGAYTGPEDSGVQTDFLEEMGRRVKAQGAGGITAVVMNQPQDLKWQASLDAAARRVAPRGRRYMLPVDRAGQAGGLMLVMAAMALDTPRPESPRLVLAGGQDGRAAAVVVKAECKT